MTHMGELLVMDDSVYSSDNSLSDSPGSPLSPLATQNESARVQPFMYEPEPSGSDNDHDSDNTDDDNDDPDPERRLGNTNWCSCELCVSMPTVSESICCCEIGQIEEKKRDVPPDTSITCITEHPGFHSICLDMWVLQNAYYLFRQHYGSSARHGSIHEQLRHTSYRQLVSWCWQWLGRHNRVVLPACAVAKIRETFPSHSGNYTGFKI